LACFFFCILYHWMLIILFNVVYSWLLILVYLIHFIYYKWNHVKLFYQQFLTPELILRQIMFLLQLFIMRNNNNLYIYVFFFFILKCILINSNLINKNKIRDFPLNERCICTSNLFYHGFYSESKITYKS